MGDTDERVSQWWVVEKVREKPVSVGLFGLGVVMGIVGVASWVGKQGEVEVIEVIEAEEKSDGEEEQMVVDVAGAVEIPGVYEVDGGTRLGVVIEMAGGFSEAASFEFVAKRVNLAAKVKDGMKVYVPFEGEDLEVGMMNGDISAYVGETAFGGAVNVNTASVVELDALWGIGESRARWIVENRPYETLEQLMSKAGIPENVLESNEGKLVVE